MKSKNTKNWLILGGSGLLGINLKAALEKLGHSTLATYHSNSIESLNFVKLDIFNNPLEVLKSEEFRPDVIVNTIALTNVDQCEKYKDLADKLNIQSVSEAIKIKNAYDNPKLIHISTDQVHNGTQGDFREQDPPSPINYYGKTKVSGEEIALKANNTLICRTNFYGPGSLWRSSFSDWIISNLSKGKEIQLFTDSIFNPLSIAHFCNLIVEMESKDLNGLFHTCGSENLSKFEFALKVANQFGFDKSLIKPIKMNDAKLLAKRPLNMTLNIDKVEVKTGRTMPNASEGIRTLDCEA